MPAVLWSNARMGQCLLCAEIIGHNPTTLCHHGFMHSGSNVWHIPINHLWLDRGSESLPMGNDLMQTRSCHTWTCEKKVPWTISSYCIKEKLSVKKSCTSTYWPDWTLGTSLAGKDSKATPQTTPCQWGRSGWGLWNRDRWPGFHILTTTVSKASHWEIEVARQMILLMGKGEFPVGHGCWGCDRPEGIEKNMLLRLPNSSLCSVRTDEKRK